MTEPNPTPPTDPGATPPTSPATTPPAEPAKASATDDKPLGEAGQKALTAEREARKALEKQLADQAKTLEGLKPLQDLAAAIGVKPESGKTSVETLTEQVAAMRTELGSERLGRMRLEVAAEKSLTPAQAARLQGATRDELAADADALKALFPAAATPPGDPAATTTTPGTPVPDLSQGARGGANELQALLATAQKDGNTKEAIRLKTLISAQQVK